MLFTPVTTSHTASINAELIDHPSHEHPYPTEPLEITLLPTGAITVAYWPQCIAIDPKMIAQADRSKIDIDDGSIVITTSKAVGHYRISDVDRDGNLIGVLY